MSAGLTVVFSERMTALHDTGVGIFDVAGSPYLDVLDAHPENAVRIRNIRAMLERGPLAGSLSWQESRPASVDELALVHTEEYIESVRGLAESGGGELAQVTPLAGDSFQAACLAAGSALQAVDLVLEGRSRLSYALVRPPGHHAQPDRADGFCVFNNTALAAARARARGCGRVAVIDIDVHHGNGTQEAFYRDASVLTVSIHMPHGAWGPNHHQTGSPAEIGAGDALGFNLNVELPLGAGDRGYAQALGQVVAPVVRQFAPELIVVAAGQDASQFDPAGRQCVSMRGFHFMGGALRALADELTDGRLVLVQEGGYAPGYSAYCLYATLAGMLGRGLEVEEPSAYLPDDPRTALPGIFGAQAAHARYWSFGFPSDQSIRSDA